MSYFIILIFKIIKIVITLFIIFDTSVGIGLCVVAVTPVYYFAYSRFTKPMFDSTAVYKEKSAKYFGEYTNLPEYMQENQIQSNDDVHAACLNRSYEDNISAYKKHIKTTNQLSLAQGALSGVLLIVCCTIGAYTVINGYTTLGRYSIISAYFMTILTCIAYFANVAKNYQNAKVSAERILELLSIPQMPEGHVQSENVSSINATINFELMIKQYL